MTQADVVVDRSSNAESVQRVTENIGRECRYVRVYVNCPASNIWPCVLEVKGVGESLNTNVALGKDATASREGSGHPASDAVDGDPSTYWTNAAMARPTGRWTSAAITRSTRWTWTLSGATVP